MVLHIESLDETVDLEAAVHFNHRAEEDQLLYFSTSLSHFEARASVDLKRPVITSLFGKSDPKQNATRMHVWTKNGFMRTSNSPASCQQ